jgi:hypothetical protein
LHASTPTFSRSPVSYDQQMTLRLTETVKTI